MIELEIQNNNQVLELEQVEVVATRTSQLINDGEDGTHPFIDATDISGKADKTYVDAQDVATLNSAKGYTDTRETSIKNWADGKFLTEHQDISHLASKTYVDNGLALKQDKINDLASIRAGAVLGTTSIQPNDNVSELVNDVGYLTSQSLSAYRTSVQQDVIDNTKVDKVQGKGLSENDYTTAEKNKLSGIQNGAEVNVQSDWNQTNQSADDYIKNKPTIPSLDNYYTKSETDNAISGHHDPNKQDTLVSGTNIKTINNQSVLGSGNIQIDGGVQSVNGQTGVVVLDAEDVGALPTGYHDSTKQDVISDLSTIRSGASLGATSIQPNDNVSELTNDAGYLTSHQSLSNYYNKTETDTLLSAKQDNLPSVVNDRYLHTNQSTGAIEWSTIAGGQGSVRYDEAQSLTDAQKLQARTNIGIASEIYGIKRALDTSSSSWIRTDSSVGLVANATHDGSSVSNDFNNIYPWSDIISVNMGNDGLITARYGDANFKFDGSNGDVMTSIPSFYWKRWQDAQYEYIQISKNNFDGAVYSPNFYVGRYNTCTGANSHSNKPPQVATTITNFRTQARAKGNGWGQLDYHYWIIQMLYLVEYANYNIKSTLGNGIQSIRYVGTDKALIAESSTNRIVIATDNVAYAVGITMNIGTAQGNPNIASYRKITSKEAYNDGTITGTAIYFDGSAVNVAVNNILWCGVQHNGQCDSLGMLSGCLNNDGRHGVIYRGVENYFANCYEFVDGLNIQNNVAYINYNQSTYQVDKFDGDYQMIGYTNATSNGYAKTFGYDGDNPMVALTTSVGGASNTYISAYYYQNTGNRIACVGGAFYAGAVVGFYWYLGAGSSIAYFDIGSRLLKLTT